MSQTPPPDQQPDPARAGVPNSVPNWGPGWGPQQDRQRRRWSRRGRILTGAAALALVVPLSGVAVESTLGNADHTHQLLHQPVSPWQSGSSRTRVTGTSSALDVSRASARQSAGLVRIVSTEDFGTGEAVGTGMVLASDGTVVTNHHVVAGATRIEATVVNTGQRFTAELLGADSTKDVAVLRLVGAHGLTTVPTDTGAVSVGEKVTAIGDAGGDGGDLTAATGTVTAQHATISVQDESSAGSATLTDLIEVNADIVPGDSGGVLRDGSGDVIGMNVAASSGGTDIRGYVIPIGRVLGVTSAVTSGQGGAGIAMGYSAFLGIELAPGVDSATLYGVLDNGAAQAAGLAAGDTITGFAGHRVDSAAQLRSLIAAQSPGGRVAITWTDPSGSTGHATVTLGRAPVA